MHKHRQWRLGLAVAGMTVAGAAAAPAFAHEENLRPLDTAQAGPAVIALLGPQVTDVPGGPQVTGAFGSPFAEPTIAGVRTDDKCVEQDTPNAGVGGPKGKVCKPAAGTLVQLADGRLLFWDALEGTENNKFSIVAEGGTTFTNDAARLLSLDGQDRPSFTTPTPFDGGANPKGDPGEPLIPGGQTTETYNDGALFGSHQSFLPDGRLLVQGGTDYSLDPGVDGIPFGAVELTGLKATRIFDPKTNRFEQTGDTASRRWYPTLVETGEGKYLDLSGVGKLLKPIYPDHPQDSLTNVKQVEEFDPATGRWRMLPRSADYDLPLYPRVHLLPDGHVFFNSGGQDFNPFGQSIGEANWVDLASLDPKTATWKKLGVANTATPTAPGFRGSTSSTMLPLTPDAEGRYHRAQFLTAGGVLLTSPGSYVATAESSITTVDTAGGTERVTQERTGPLAQPRWFGQNIVLPTGQVVVFSGADKDEVVLPGTEMAVQQSELFDPATKKWSPIAVQHQPRTYHNTAVLRPDGTVLVGGHATISTAYLNNTTLPGGFAPHDGRDPSFEVFRPPYLFQGARPAIASAASTMGYGRTFDITVDGPADDIASVALVRNSAITHIVDADQRTVMLRVVGRNGKTLTVESPPDGNVAPPGPYMLFVNRKNGAGQLVPSAGRQLMVSTNGAAADRAAAKSTGAARCVSRRSFTVHVPRAYRRTVRRVSVRIGTGKARTLRRGAKATRVSLRGRAKGTVRVQLRLTLRGGRKVTDTRRYRLCVRRG